MKDNIYIDGFGFSNYRSFGEELSLIGPLNKINIFIGKNNSGKSNILSFSKNCLPNTISYCRDLTRHTRNDIDTHLGLDPSELSFSLGIKINESLHHQIIINCQEHSDQTKRQKDFIASSIDSILSSPTLSKGGDIAWFTYSESKARTLSLTDELIVGIKNDNILRNDQWYLLWQLLCNLKNGDILKDWIPDTLKYISPVKLEPPIIFLIPAFRKITQGNSELFYSGSGLIDKVAQIQNPGFDKQESKNEYNKINLFLKTVLDNQTAKLEVPYERDEFIVYLDGKVLPLSSLGTGIHEVVILAVAATVIKNSVICIEEPELHIHPLLQKKLIQYFNEQTDNQYLITTHSASILNTLDAAVFHVMLENNSTVVKSAKSPTEKASITQDLGYCASDLLQTNCIIWVEGPSDRIYINHWIINKAPELTEGIDYTIMFYGGRLLSHLTANDPEIDDFISLRKMNRNICIVMDSDKDKPRKRINPTKTRIKEEFDKGLGFAWITKGREIENYINEKVLESAVKKVYPQGKGLQNRGQFENLLTYTSAKGEKKTYDKVKVSKEVVNIPPDFEILDLNPMVNKLVHFIKESNKNN